MLARQREARRTARSAARGNVKRSEQVCSASIPTQPQQTVSFSKSVAWFIRFFFGACLGGRGRDARREADDELYHAQPFQSHVQSLLVDAITEDLNVDLLLTRTPSW
jgi:hypothetical protein